MIDIYRLFVVVFGLLGYFISGGGWVWSFIAGIGVGVWVGLVLLLQINQGHLFILMVYEWMTRGVG